MQIAVQLVHPQRPLRGTGGLCVWYAADRRLLVASGCGNPYFFSVAHRRGRWSWSAPAGTALPAGRYSVRVRGIDRTGNISYLYSLRLRTIVPFVLR